MSDIINFDEFFEKRFNKEPINSEAYRKAKETKIAVRKLVKANSIAEKFINELSEVSDYVGTKMLIEDIKIFMENIRRDLHNLQIIISKHD